MSNPINPLKQMVCPNCEILILLLKYFMISINQILLETKFFPYFQNIVISFQRELFTTQSKSNSYFRQDSF